MKNVSRDISVVTVALLLLLIPFSLHASEVTGKVQATVDGVLDVLREQSLQGPSKKEERRAKLRSIISGRFSYEEMSKQSLAIHWRKRSEAEKKEFVSLFSNLIETAYIEKIEGYTDEEILYTGERVKDRHAEVLTTIVSKGTEIPINYRLFRTRGGDWMVYDLVIEGVSLVSNYRLQFSSTIRTSSYEGLVGQLREKMAE